ncbi:5-formyltetrahydrofolate cyclo-ligase [Kozakia baliensis]|uniref:5-formyltetrahydrofolate cyclo-ligase n=1 Tax=Kozakia baliensis TaxID=153496 RepID=A0A1D8URH0_9PROT|nr:5-formyltetrahydrofolate cyclo-ligase [Kozakia baliensis]AOX16107.1 hypothetical protein A0U89_02005 [Kozakia baliensis]GBR27905.1 5-formyltetrahydrofolate cyclo-ligase [Kozakia baliensis NRIC 0488]GEL65417.1 hypothetical protein KBA01_27030 [Kozakia baliensis]
MVVPHDIDQQKSALREKMRSTRAARVANAMLDVMLCEELRSAVLSTPNRNIGCVWPLPGEADLRPLCQQLHEAGRNVLLPETTPRGSALVFRHWTPDATMKPGRFGTFHPHGPVLQPDLLLVPLLAFDRAFNRLGYGGGYYDRTLEAFRCHAIGFAFNWQEVASVPCGPHDRTLDLIVTETGPIFPHEKEHSAQ